MSVKPADVIEFTPEVVAQLRSEKGWTPLRIAYARHLYVDGGYSARDVAARIGDITRNAVIGMLTRNKISQNVKRPHQSGARSRPRTGAFAVKPKVTKPAGSRLPPNWHAPRFDIHPLHNAPNIVVPTNKKVTMVGLEDHHCRYPLGEPMDKVEFYCGQDRAPGVSVCVGHAVMCFRHPVPRRAANDAGNPVILTADGQTQAGGGMSNQNTKQAAGDALEAAE